MKRNLLSKRRFFATNTSAFKSDNHNILIPNLTNSFAMMKKSLQRAKSLFCLFILAIGFVFNASATNYTSVGGNWNSTSSWSPAGIPGSGDNVTISTGTITVNVASSVANITISGGTLSMSAGLTVYGTWTFSSGTFTPNTQTVTFATGSSIANGAASLTFYNLAINTTNTTDVVTNSKALIIIANGGTLSLTKGILNVGASNVIQMGTSSATTIDASGGGNFATTGTNGSDGGNIDVRAASGGAITIKGTGSVGSPTLYNIYCGSTSDANWRLTLNNAGVKINGTLSTTTLAGATVANSNQWACNTNSPVWGPNSTLIVNRNNQGYTPGNEWNATTGYTIGTTAGYPNNVTIANVGTSGGSVGGVNVGLNINSARYINGTLTIGTSTVAAAVGINNAGWTCGGIVINSGSSLGAATNFTVKGNWLRQGTTIGAFSATAGITVTFGGSGTYASPQTIDLSTGTETFANNANIAITNATYVKLSKPVTLGSARTLTLTSGILQTDATNILSITNTATSAISGTGAGGNCINGPVKWTLLSSGTNNYVFPIGAGTTSPVTYLPLTLSSKNTLASNVATAQAFASASGGTLSGYNLGSEYWTLATSGNLTTTGSTVSVYRPTTVTASSVIAKNSALTGAYTSFGGTVSASPSGITGSNDLGTGTISTTYFAIASPAPVITGAATATAFTTTYGTVSAAQTFSVSGSGLSANLIATAPTGFEVSNGGGSYAGTATFTQSGGSASGTLYIRLAATAAVSGTYNSQNIVLSSTGATSVNITTAASGNTVSQKALTITANSSSKTYGSLITFSGTEFSTSGLANSDAISSVSLSSTGAATTATVSGSPYIITPSSAVFSTGTAGNYSITYADGSLTVNAKSLTITASNKTKTYGSSLILNGSTDFTTSGLVNSDAVSSVTLTCSAASDITATVSGSPYTIVPSAASGTGLSNYSISYANGTLTVNAKSLTITASDNSKTYGDVISFAGSEFTTSGLVNSDAVTSVTLTSTGASASVGVAGSPYNIVPSAAIGTGLGNYSITYTNGSLIVNKAALTITANAVIKDEGSTLTGGSGSTEFTSSGLVNSETIGTVTITYGSSADAGASPGVYAGDVTPSAATGGTFTAGNYTITYVSGNVTVQASNAPVCPASTAVTPSADQTICQGVSTNQLTAAITNSGTLNSYTAQYQWYYNTTNSNTVSGATLISGAIAANYTPLSTSAEVGTRYYFCVGYATDNTCGQTNATQYLASAPVKVTVNGTPSTPTASNNGPICAGATLNLTSSTISGASYAWTGPNGFSSAIQNPSISNATAAATGDYSVVATVNGCVSAAGTTSVVVNAIPAQTITAPSGVCANSTGNTASVSLSAGGSYAWTISGGTITSASNIQSITFTAGASGSVVLNCVVTSSAGCSSTGGQNTSITINAIPAQTITAAAAVCANSIGNTASVTTTSGASYSWSISGGTITAGQAASTVTYTAGASGSVVLNCVVTSSSNCSSAGGQNTSVTINSLPTPSFTSQPGASVCSGTDVTYTTQSGQSNYLWTGLGVLNTDYSITSGGVGTSSSTVTLKWLTTGTKTVSINYTNSNSCTAPVATSSTATTVNATPTVTSVAAGSITINGATANGTVSANGVSTTASFNYGTTTGYGSSVTATQSPVTTQSAAVSAVITGLTPNTLYHFQVSGANANCSATGSDLTFTTLSNAPTVGGPSSITSSGFTASWTAPSGQGAASLTYTVEVSTSNTFTSIATSVTGVSGTSTAITGLSASTTYYFRVKAVNAGGSSAYSSTSAAVITGDVDTDGAAPAVGNNINSVADQYTIYSVQRSKYLYDATGTSGAYLTYDNGTPTVGPNTKYAWYETDNGSGLKAYKNVTYGNYIVTQSTNYVGFVNTGCATENVNRVDLVNQTTFNGLADNIRYWTKTLVSGSTYTLTNAFILSSWGYYLNTAYSTSSSFQVLISAGNCSSNRNFTFTKYTATPDLSVSGVSTSLVGNAAAVSTPFLATATITNNGLYAISNGTSIKVKFVLGGQIYTTTYTGGLAAGASATLPAVTITPNQQLASVSLVTTVNSNWTVAEYDYSNNSNTISGIVVGPQDLKPIVLTTAATSVTATSAVLNGSVSANNDNTNIYFNWGTSNSPYNNLAVAATPSSLTGATVTPVTLSVSGLSPQTTYNFQVYGTNSYGTNYGSNLTLLTPSAAPTAQAGGLTATVSNNTANFLSTGSVTIGTPATFPVSGANKAGYLVIYSTGTPAIVASPNGQTPASIVTNGTVVSTTETTLPAVPSTAVSISSALTSCNTYNVLVIPYTWDGTNTSSYSYLTASAPTVQMVTTSSAYNVTKTPWTAGATIQAEDWDYGGEGCAFHEGNQGVTGVAYRTDGNSTATPWLQNAGSGKTIGYGRTGEYLVYTVNIPATANYKFDLNYSSTDGRTLGVEIFVDGVSKATLAGNATAYTTYTTSAVALTAGTRKIKIQFNTDEVNFDWFKFYQTTFNITSSAGANGSISPSGSTTVNLNANQAYTITPNTNYKVADVLVDGVSVGAVTSYTFSNVTAAHTIAASFTLKTYAITSSAGANGSISPNGSTDVTHGNDQAYTFTSSTGYHINQVLVDGVNNTTAVSAGNYTFTNVTATHTIAVSFAINTYTITASAASNGSINPSGASTVNYGSNKAYTITANSGYHVEDVLVDGVSVGAVTDYTFTNVTTNHTIDVSFAPDCTGYTWTNAQEDFDYYNPANWACGVVPPDGADISIDADKTIYLANDLVLGDVTFANGAVIDFNGYSLEIDGAVTGTTQFMGYSASNLTIGAGANVGTLNFVSGGQVLHNLVLMDNSSASLGTPLDITAGATPGSVTVASGAILTTNDNLTIKSDIDGTARVASSAGTITGNVTTERYVPQNVYRGWRMLSVPTTGGQSIKASWQEGATSYNDNPKPGFGTRITSNSATAVASGYDAQTYGNSLLSYTPGVSPSWVGVTSNLTTTPVSSNSGWMIYIRGDRSIDTSQLITGSSQTILRSKGPLRQGTQSINLVDGFNLVGNPFASEIDFSNISKSVNVSDAIYLWDPKVYGSYGLGAFQSFSSPDWMPTPGGGSYGATVNTKIQSGQAFLVYSNGAGTLQITESSKTDGTNAGGSGFRPSNNASSFRTNLFAVVNGVPVLADGNAVSFDDNYDNATNAADMLKAGNFGESVGLLRGTKLLAQEQRKTITDKDSIFYRMSGIKTMTYQLEFKPTNLNNSGLTAILQDSYLQTETPLSVGAVTRVNFTANATNVATFANRFRVVFKNTNPLPLIITNVKAAQTGSAIKVEWTTNEEVGIRSYVIERSSDGIHFSAIGTVSASGLSGYSLVDKNPVTGANNYRIRCISNAGNTSYSAIVKVMNGKVKSSIDLAVNPVKNGVVNLLFNDQIKGNYFVKVITTSGQIINESRITHAGGNASVLINLAGYLSKGLYRIDIVTPKNEHVMHTVMIE